MKKNESLDVKEFVKELNKVIQKMYGEGDEIIYWARELLAVMKRHGIGE